MLFVFSKIFGFLAQPSTLVWLLLVIGLMLGRRRRTQQRGRRLAITAAVLVPLVGLTPLSTWLLVPLEERFPRIEVAPGSLEYAGIIVLGGGEDGRASVERGQLHINEAGERVIQGGVLARRLPQARLIFAGGVSAIVGDIPRGANAVGDFWQAVGISPDRIVIESRSRNTYENAILTRALIDPKPGERFLLVTSAGHMPRSMGVFRHAGFDVVAYPVDFRTNAPLDALDTFSSIPAGMKRFDDATKEWIGLVAYWLLRRSSSLFPGPGQD